MSVYAPRGRGSQGLTVVELIIVIAVLSILVTLTRHFIGDWRGRTAQTEVKNDLYNVAAAMEDARNFGTGYPATIPGSYIASPNVSMQLMTSTSTTFCINGSSITRNDVRFFIKNQSAPAAGYCP